MVNPKLDLDGQSFICFSWSILICFRCSILHLLFLVNPTFSVICQSYIFSSWSILYLLFLTNPKFALLGQSYICSSWSILHLLSMVNPTFVVQVNSIFTLCNRKPLRLDINFNGLPIIWFIITKPS